MALSDYDKLYLSANQQAQIQNLTNKWNQVEEQYKQAQQSGNTALADQLSREKADLHTQAETIRATQGYLGGVEGTEYNAFEQPKQQAVYTPPSYDFSSSVKDNSSYLEDMYAAQKAAALSSINAAYEKNKAAIDRAEYGIAEGYQTARNDTAGASELAKRNNAQYAAAYGLNTGTGGQMELARNVTLQNNLNSINTAEGQSMADLALQRANAETAYNDAIVQAEQQGNYELAESLYQEKVRVQETLLNLQIQQAQMEYQAYRDSVGDSQWQQSFNQSAGQQNFQNYFNMLQYANGLAQQGYENLVGQNKGTTTPTMTLATAKQAAANGAFDAEVIATLKDNGYTDNMLSLIYGYNGGTGSNNNISGTPVTGTGTTAYDNGSLTADQVREMQAHYGLSVDGYWGPNSQKTTGMSANEAWAQYQKSKGALTLDNATMSTPGYVELVNELTRIEDSGRNVATKAAVAIQEALEDGKITQALADKLFAQYGL